MLSVYQKQKRPGFLAIEALLRTGVRIRILRRRSPECDDALSRRVLLNGNRERGRERVGPERFRRFADGDIEHAHGRARSDGCRHAAIGHGYRCSGTVGWRPRRDSGDASGTARSVFRFVGNYYGLTGREGDILHRFDYTLNPMNFS